MKRIMVFLTLSMLALSCGTEELAIEYAPENNLVSNTALREKVMRVAQNPTAVDNIIDGSDCFSIKMPYAVYVNGVDVNINSTADLAQVETILNASDYDYDSVGLMFPITVVYADYTEETFTTALYFFNAVDTCTGTRELGCVDLAYPVGVKTYNSENALAQSFELGDKEALYGFLNSVEAYSAATLTYPLQFVTPDGTTIAVENNAALEQQIDANTPVCEAEYFAPVPDLATVIGTGNWGITYYFDGDDNTAAYSQYIFIFNPDMTMTVTGSFPATDAQWSTYSPVDVPTLSLFSFTDTFLSGLEESWIVTEITPTDVYFFTPSNGVTPQKYLRFTRLD